MDEIKVTSPAFAEGEIIPAEYTADGRNINMKKLVHVCPLLMLISFCALYSWMNITLRLFVGRFGCGCPPLDGSCRFNTNHLTMIVLGIAAVLTSIPYVLLERRLPEKLKMAYLIFFFASIMFISLFTMGRNWWL